MRKKTAPPPDGLDYARSLYVSITDWYKDSHSRAQIVLTVDGAFITLLAGAIVMKQADLHDTVSAFGPETWAALLVMVVAFAVSGGSALWALMPLRLSSATIQADFNRLSAADRAAGREPPVSVMWYSQFIRLIDREDFIKRISLMNHEREREALAVEIHILSERLKRKYRCVFAAYLATALALLMLLLAAADYAVRSV